MKRIERSTANSNINYYTDYDINLLKDKNVGYLNYASYYIYENVFNKEEIEDYRNRLSKYDALTHKGAVIGKDEKETISQNYRNSDIIFLDPDPELEPFENKLLDAVEAVNKNIFNFNLTCFMNPQYTLYNKDMYFDWHPDGPLGVLDSRGLNCIPTNLQWRKLSVVLMLTDADTYTGGDFQILNPSRHPSNAIDTIRLDAGSIIVLPSFLAHRVTPVELGNRKTLVYWFCGPRWS